MAWALLGTRPTRPSLATGARSGGSSVAFGVPGPPCRSIYQGVAAGGAPRPQDPGPSVGQRCLGPVPA
eukprot:14918486-Alexandrium_andersonii.AAC.1